MLKAVCSFACIFVLSCSLVNAERKVYSLDFNWKFLLFPDSCSNVSNTTFPKDLSNMQCNGLSQQPAATAHDCALLCCASAACRVWQFCAGGDAGCGAQSCWTGRLNQCTAVQGWQSRARDSAPPPPSRCDVKCVLKCYTSSERCDFSLF
jgi:hypothetical protein